MLEKNTRKVILNLAVRGMLPKSRLGRAMVKEIKGCMQIGTSQKIGQI